MTLNQILAKFSEHPYFAEHPDRLNHDTIISLDRDRKIPLREVEAAVVMCVQYPEKFYDPATLFLMDWPFRDGKSRLTPPVEKPYNPQRDPDAKAKFNSFLPGWSDAWYWYQNRDPEHADLIDRYIRDRLTVCHMQIDPLYEAGCPGRYLLIACHRRANDPRYRAYASEYLEALL